MLEPRQQHEPRALVLRLDGAAERRSDTSRAVRAAPIVPKSAQLNGTFRLLSSADTSTLDFMYPRNFIAPDGRVFGYDSSGRMYYVNPTGTGTITNVGQFAASYRGSDASAAMFRPGRILQFGGNSNGALVIDITRRHAGRDADAVDVVAAPAGQRHGPAERQGARDRRQPGQQRS